MTVHYPICFFVPLTWVGVASQCAYFHCLIFFLVAAELNMEMSTVILSLFLTLTLLTTAASRPHGDSQNQELTQIASELTHALSEREY
jgi:hypothetical protein